EADPTPTGGGRRDEMAGAAADVEQPPPAARRWEASDELTEEIEPRRRHLRAYEARGIFDLVEVSEPSRRRQLCGHRGAAGRTGRVALPAMRDPPKRRGGIAGHAADGASRRDIFFGEGAEHVLQRIDRATPAILPLGVGLAGAAQIAHGRGIPLAALEEATDPIRDRRRADVGEEQGAVEWLENLRRGSHRRAEDGGAARPRFHRDQARSLRLAGRQDSRRRP